MKVKSNKSKKGALKASILKKVKENTQIVADIIKNTGKSYPTVMRWLKDNSIQLTQVDCLNTICKGLDVEQSEVLN